MLLTVMELLRGAVAHNLEAIPRTIDVALSENITFSNLLLNQKTLNGLHQAGFSRPSPVQRYALPRGLCGSDLIVQAKSGTGKTLVFGVIALERIDLMVTQPQVLILAPTREIAVQIKQVLTSISIEFPNLKIAAFIGGLTAVNEDMVTAKDCQIVVGTPGRVKQLVMNNSLSTQAIRLFVLDEADRMVDKTFLKDVCYIFSKLPERKQSIVCSATYPPKMENLLTKFLVHPERINPSQDTLLLGLRQFVAVVPVHTNILARVRNKTNKLLEILSSLAFRQCLIFCNIQSRMESICKDLASRGWPALHLAGSMPQKQRLSAIASLQNHTCRILLTTDLAARGVDAEQVDLVFNLDLPYDTETYLHRIGRAGRFGAPGIAISIVDTNELKKLREIFFDVGGSTLQVPLLPDSHISAETWTGSVQLDRVEALVRESQETVEQKVEECDITKDVAEIFRSHLIVMPKNLAPIPYHVLLKQQEQGNCENVIDDVELRSHSEENELSEKNVKTLNTATCDTLKVTSHAESSSADEELPTSECGDKPLPDTNHHMNIFWRQQLLYINDMCQYADSRTGK